MSPTKRRNHYIPRMLLNRFASRSQAEKFWVWQVCKQGEPKEISTKDAAVSSFFYGTSDTGVEEALAVLESRVAHALERIEAGEPFTQFQEELRRFVYLVFIRTRALREHFIETGQRAIGAFARSLRPDIVRKAVKREMDGSFDNLLIEAATILPPPQREAMLSLLKMRQVRDFLLHSVAREIDSTDITSLIRGCLDALQERRLLCKPASDGQIRGLARLLEQSHIPESFNPQKWKLARASSSPFVLGDICAFAQSHDGRYGSLLRFGDDWDAVFLPVSRCSLLIGTRNEYSLPFDLGLTNKISAELSRDFIFASEVTDGVRMLAGSIGRGSVLLSDEEIDVTMEEVWSDLK